MNPPFSRSRFPQTAPAADSGQAPRGFQLACAIHGIPPTRFLLWINVTRQQLTLFQRAHTRSAASRFAPYVTRQRIRISTSRFGIGQLKGSHQTPLGLHRIAKKIGAGYPVGAVWKHRQFAGWTWQGQPDAPIAHRILWLEGMEPGLNRGGNADSFSRFIYIHGVGDETALGRPASIGCIHVAAADLLPLHDIVPTGTLVWIE